MSSKNISLREDAYERLAARKREGESFSDVVLRLTADDPGDFSNLIGAEVTLALSSEAIPTGRTEADERREQRLRERIESHRD
jgi:predicted CopG family antitoxin